MILPKSGKTTAHLPSPQFIPFGIQRLFFRPCCLARESVKAGSSGDHHNISNVTQGVIMSLIDQIGSMLGGSSGDEANAGALKTLLDQSGGISGLISKFQQGGLGEVAQSWISSGQNLPISADQLHQVLGSDTVAAVAQKLGVDPQEAASHLSQLLPKAVDTLTPNGELPSSDSLLSSGLDILKGKLFG
ncbi:YidB family protein [Silvimonas soli]|uniref:YidB family protein n=1 Tax=Silvimonas soli TaxID=2980100 RepID=UPI0036F28889